MTKLDGQIELLVQGKTEAKRNLELVRMVVESSAESHENLPKTAPTSTR